MHEKEERTGLAGNGPLNGIRRCRWIVLMLSPPPTTPDRLEQTGHVVRRL